MARIFWTNDEKNAVAGRSFELRRDAEYSDIECVRRAMQELISTERHRNLIAMSEVPYIHEAWVILTQSQRDADLLEGSQPKQVIQPVRHPEAERDERFQRETIAISDIPFDQLWTEMGRRLTEMASGEALQQLVRREVRAQLRASIPGILHDDTPVVQPQQEQRKRRMKVYVFGLLNGQQELFKREYKDTVEFQFTDGSPSLSKLKNVSLHMHWVVQMLKFSNQVKGVSAIDNYQACPGAITQLREFLNRKLKDFADA